MWAPLQLHWEGLSLRWLLAAERRLEGAWVSVLQSMGSEVAVRGLYSTGLVVLVHGLSCSAACGIFLDQGLNLCLLHWQANSLPLSHEGSLDCKLKKILRLFI